MSKICYLCKNRMNKIGKRETERECHVKCVKELWIELQDLKKQTRKNSLEISDTDVTKAYNK